MPADAIIADLLRPRADQAASAGHEKFLADAYTGGGGFGGRIQRPATSPEAIAYSGIGGEASYLDKFTREDDAKFASRCKVAHYTNYCRPTTELKVSYLFRKGWQYTNEPPEITEWRARNRFDEENSKRATLACVFGWSPVVVDMPELPADARSLADVKGKRDPYLSTMLPIQLLDWEVDSSGELVFAKTAVRTEEREDWRSLVPTRVTRVTLWTRTTFQVFVIRQGAGTAGGTEQIVDDLGEQSHPFGEVPVVPWRASINVDDPIRGESIMADVAVLNRRIFNIQSEQEEHVRGQVFALLLIPRANVERMPGETDDEYATRTALDVGTENGLTFDPDQKNAPHFIAPPGDVAKTYKELLNDAVIELYRLARVEYDRASGSHTSAQSKQQNFEQTNLAVVDIAKSMAGSILKTLRLVGRGLGVSEDKLAEFSVSAYDSYASEDLNADLEVADALLIDPGMGSTFKVEMRKRIARRVLTGVGSATLKAIDGDIEAEDAKAEQAQVAMTEVPAINVAGVNGKHQLNNIDAPLGGAAAG